jgi:hypothetical protein
LIPEISRGDTPRGTGKEKWRKMPSAKSDGNAICKIPSAKMPSAKMGSHMPSAKMPSAKFEASQSDWESAWRVIAQLDSSEKPLHIKEVYFILAILW